MEEQLDKISDGQASWLESLRGYYELLDKYLQQGQETDSIKKNGIPVEEKCPKCGRNLVIKEGRYGRFKACSGYPDCNYKESLVKKETKTIEAKCPLCGSPLVYRGGRYGTFIACSNYPHCKYIHKENSDTGLPCPLGCGGTIIKRKTRRGKYFYGCSHYPQCRFATWDEIVNEPCPKCGATYLLKKSPKKGKPYLYCQKCDYVRYLDGEQNPAEAEVKKSQEQLTEKSEETSRQAVKSSIDSDEKRN